MMMKRYVAVLLMLFLWLNTFHDKNAFASDELRDYLKEQTRYWGIEQSLTKSDLDLLVDLKRKAEAAGLTQEQRSKAYGDLFRFVQKLRGLPEGRVPAELAAGFWRKDGPLVVRQSSVAASGQFGKVTRHGTGKTAMILIPDIGADSTVFESFMQRNQPDYQFFAVTLAGFGGTKPPTRPKKLDFGKGVWWNNATTAVLNLIKQEKLTQPVLLGHQAGAYLAMRLALDHPDLVRGAIVINGMLYMSTPAIPNDASRAERVRIVNGWTPAELFPNPTQDQYRAMMLQNGEWYCKNKQRQADLAAMMSRTTPATWWNYFAELATTDLRADMLKLKVPMLVLPSVFDASSPGVETSKMTLEQWNGLLRANSSLPIRITPIQDARGYATEDQPLKLDEAIRKWSEEL